ncbi:MAG: TonB-dependent receptor [Litorimonas sp.]
MAPSVQAQTALPEGLEVGPTTDAADQTETYPRDFFERFAPQTAFDLLSRVPGFAVSGGADLRGFGSGAGNVLIDGSRPTTKSDDLESVLRRIPANAVERIELTRGAQRAGETAGQSIVANVVRRRETVAGTWSAELERNAEGLVYPRGELSVTAPLGNWSTTTRLNAFWEQFVFVDFDRARFDADGNLTLFEEETLPSTLRDAFISTEAKRPLAGGTLTVNARFGNSRFYQETGRDGFFERLPDDRPDRRTDIRLDSEFWTGELGADWARTLSNDWAVKLLGLGSLTDSRVTSRNVVAEPVGAFSSASRFAADRTPFELLARGTYGKLDGALRPEFGLEAAYNRLDSRIALETEAADGTISPIALPASDVGVEEVRGEAFVNLNWTARPDWTVETGLAVEASEITVGGDADARSRFTFFKPSVALTHRMSDTVQLRASLRRTVGQLDFNDFAASANAEDGRLLGGNPDLGPDQTTRASVSADLRTGAGAALNVEIFHEWRSDVLEQVRLPSGAFGVANAGSARLWGLEAEATLPLGFLVPGGLLEADAVIRDSAFEDPLTGRVRNITALRTPDINIAFRQDLPQREFAWGVSYAAQDDLFFFFADEVDTDAVGDFWTAFVETTRFFGVKAQLEIRNIGGRAFPRERRFFAPDRGGALTGTERLDRERGAYIKLTVSDQF